MALALLNNGLYGYRKAATEVFGRYAISLSESWKGGIRNIYEQFGLSREMSVGEFLDNYTALAIFKPFMTTERYVVAQKKILDTSSCGITHLLGTTGTSFFKSSHYYCPECMMQELRDLGYAFPHRAHQLTGIALCPLHDTRLGNLNHEDPVFHYINGLVLPAAQTVLMDPPLNVSTEPEYLEVSRKFSMWVDFILHNGLPYYPIEQRMAVMRTKLQSFWEASGVPRSLFAHPEYILRRSFGSGFLHDLGWGLDKGQTSHWPALLLQGQTYAEQPIANILMMAALFANPQEFMEMVSHAGEVAPTKRITAAKRSRFRSGISRELLRDFLSMPCLREIAEKHGMHVATVKVQMRALPGLAERRKAALFRRRRRYYRQVVEKMVKDNPNMSRSVLAQVHYVCYHWLLNNDRTWLDNFLPCKEWWLCRHPPSQSVRDFTQEDMSVKKQLREFVEQTTKALGAIRITKGLLLEQISKEKQLSLCKGQFPQAAAFIQGAAETKNQYESRVVNRIRLLIGQGDRIGCQALTAQFLMRNKGRFDLLGKVTGLLCGASAAAPTQRHAS